MITAEMLSPARLAQLNTEALVQLCRICTDHDIALSDLRDNIDKLTEDELRTISICLE